jgi:hypothetical protein
MDDKFFYGAVLLIAVSMIGIYFGIIDGSQTKEEIRNAMYTALGITVIVTLIFTVVTYKFFTVNTDYTYPYLLIMNGLVMLMSVSALAISMINVSHV